MKDMGDIPRDLRRGIPLPHLAAWRRARLLTQEELARRARVTRMTVYHAEHGRPVKIPIAARLARALRVEPQALASGVAPEARDA